MLKNNLKLSKILWMDLEMTGLDPNEDAILEVAAIVTDWQFDELETYTGIVKNSDEELQRRMQQNSDFWTANPSARQGIIEQNHQGKTLTQIENELLELIERHFPVDLPVLLGGNSIHMDRRFIDTKWPKFSSKLFYRMLDVSAWKVVFEYKYGKLFTKANEHRALDDIRGSISELKYYLEIKGEVK